MLVLLDGLDEVRGSFRSPVVNMMDDLASRGHRLVVSTRPTNWDLIREQFGLDDEKTEKREAHLKALPVDTDPSAIRWRWQWAATLDLGVDMRRLMVQARLGLDSRRFLEELDKKSDFKELAKSPLLLSMLMHVFKEGGGGGSLPSNRAHLHDAAVRTLVEGLERQKGRGVAQRCSDADPKRLMLERVAHHVHLTRGDRPQCSRKW